MSIKRWNDYIKESNEHDSESELGLAKVQLEKIIENSKEILENLDMEDIPAWVQDKLSVSNHNMEAIVDWLNSKEVTNESKNTPKDKKLWNKALALAKGSRNGGSTYVTVDGERHDAPNDGKGYDEYPSAYSNSYAAKKYKEFGGKWETTNEDLRDWHKEKWVRIDTNGNITGECGTMKDEKNPSRCLPEKKAKSLTKEERAKTARKKKRSNKKYVANTDKAKVSKK